MRETCARVLAAALMTGAIATAMGLPPALQSDDGPRAALVSPPSSHERSVRLVALPAPKRPVRAERRVDARTKRPALIRRAVVTRRAPAPAPPPRPKPAPAPAPEPERQLAAAPPVTEQPPAVVPPPAPVVVAEPPATEESRGHAYGHDKQDDKDKEKKDKRKD